MRTLLCSHPALCVLIEKTSLPTMLSFPFQNQLPDNVVPVFPAVSTVYLGSMAVKQSQIPLTPAFVLTEYKIQGSTFISAVLDLKKIRKPKADREIHKLFCSTYVQLSRVTSLQGVRLLEKTSWEDVSHKPHPALQKETARLD